MAGHAFYKTAVRKIAQALKSYASEKGLRKSDYRMLFGEDPDWEAVLIVFAVKPGAFDPDPDRWFEIKRYLNAKFADQPEIVRAVNLRVEEDSDANVMMSLFEERLSPPEEVLSDTPAV